MKVMDLCKKYDYCERADLVLIEQLEKKIETLEKVIINLCNRVDYLENKGE